MRILLIFLMSLTICSFSFSQSQPAESTSQKSLKPEERAAQFSDNLTKTLNLTTAQSKQLLKLSLSYEKQLDQINNDKSLTTSQKYDKLTLQRVQRNKKLKEILTKEQYKKYSLSFP